MRILLAEDEKALSKAIVKIFERNNYSADAVYNGEDAVSYIESGNYDVAVLDIMMPKIDGLTALKKIRADGYNIPVIMLTAKSIVLCGSPDAIRQLTSILLDNAAKYSPAGGTVTIDLYSNKKNAVLTVFNATETRINKDDLPHVFDRFYRTDSSRNSATGGHGIGLSIAKAIVDAHDGKIIAETKSGNDFGITATLPLKIKT